MTKLPHAEIRALLKYHSGWSLDDLDAALIRMDVHAHDRRPIPDPGKFAGFLEPRVRIALLHAVEAKDGYIVNHSCQGAMQRMGLVSYGRRPRLTNFALQVRRALEEREI